MLVVLSFYSRASQSCAEHVSSMRGACFAVGSNPFFPFAVAIVWPAACDTEPHMLSPGSADINTCVVPFCREMTWEEQKTVKRSISLLKGLHHQHVLGVHTSWVSSLSYTCSRVLHPPRVISLRSLREHWRRFRRKSYSRLNRVMLQARSFIFSK